MRSRHSGCCRCVCIVLPPWLLRSETEGSPRRRQGFFPRVSMSTRFCGVSLTGATVVWHIWAGPEVHQPQPCSHHVAISAPSIGCTTSSACFKLHHMFKFVFACTCLAFGSFFCCMFFTFFCSCFLSLFLLCYVQSEFVSVWVRVRFGFLEIYLIKASCVMIRLESEPIILLHVHCCSSYVHWKPGYLSNDYIRCSSSSLIRTLHIVYQAFQFIWG